jgi:hypothetical protein
MASMHEDVHQRTSCKQEPRQKGKNMSAVLRNQEERTNDGKDPEREPGARRPDSMV